MKTRIEDWEAFNAVVSEKNFTKAAKKLRISAPMLTKKIIRLEKDLGVRLFQRSTRSVALTQSGALYLPALAQAFSSIEILERTAQINDDALKGLIRITAPAIFSQKILPKPLSRFLNKYTDISIELIADDRTLNMINDHIDFAIRTSPLKDSSLVARRLCKNQVIACASPKYLANSAPLKTVADLKNHRLLFMDVHKKLRFRGTRFTLEHFTKYRQVTCVDGLTLTAMALEHAGVAIRSRWDLEPFLSSGKLVPVLKDQPLEDADEAWIYLPSRKNVPRRVRALHDHLISELS